MRIGGQVGPEQTVRQGKFLDCVLVNEIRADLMESPAIAMVSRDFVSLDGQYVLIPAGAKLIGSAGHVQNLQQARIYLRLLGNALTESAVELVELFLRVSYFCDSCFGGKLRLLGGRYRALLVPARLAEPALFVAYPFCCRHRVLLGVVGLLLQPLRLPALLIQARPRIGPLVFECSAFLSFAFEALLLSTL
jgi:hypothetical protein